MTNLDSILKRRDIICQQRYASQSYGFSSSHVWMWEVDHKESWVLKKWCFQTVVLEKTHESPLDCKESKPSIVKEINPEYPLEGLMLKLQYSGHLMLRTDSLEKTLKLGKIEGRRRMQWQRMVGWHNRLDGHEFDSNSGSWRWTGKPGMLQSMGLHSQIWLSDRTTW